MSIVSLPQDTSGRQTHRSAAASLQQSRQHRRRQGDACARSEPLLPMVWFLKFTVPRLPVREFMLTGAMQRQRQARRAPAVFVSHFTKEDHVQSDILKSRGSTERQRRCLGAGGPHPLSDGQGSPAGQAEASVSSEVAAPGAAWRLIG